jgi:hypothetical protein
MTKKSPRIYTYKITFEKVPYYYYGVHKEKKFGEEYWGSPKTNKWCWKFYTPKKQILELFDYSDDGYIEALKVEKRLIKPFFNTDKWCLNENCGGFISLEVCKKAGSKGGQKSYENLSGFFSLPEEQRRQIRKKAGQKSYENSSGIHGLNSEQRSESGKKGGRTTYENGVGCFSLTLEKRIEARKKAGNTNKENRTGVCGLSSEQLSKAAKKSNSQRWQCTVTGYVSNAGGLSAYQKKRGIETCNRVRIA